MSIHIDVEPDHIIRAHGGARGYMEGGHKDEVVQASAGVMADGLPLAFARLAYPGETALPPTSAPAATAI